MSNVKKLPTLKRAKKSGVHIGCLNCSTVTGADKDGVRLAPLDMVIAVGFGYAAVTCDGATVYQEDDAQRHWTVADAEKRARRKPSAVWEIVKHGPLHGETYQRHGHNRWVLVESNMGFA